MRGSPIQGTSADVIKIAMIRIHKLLGERDFSARMILQVHDELIFDTPTDELERLRLLVREEMEAAVKLCVPLKVDIHEGKDWAACK